MATSNIAVTEAWTKLAADTDTDVLVTWDTPVTLEVATTAADSAPTVIGHKLPKCSAVTRTAIGPGFIWAKLVAGSVPASTPVIVSK